MAISLEIIISHEGRKHVFSESYRKTQPISQLLGGGVMEKGQMSGSLTNIRSGAGVRVIWGLSLKK